MLAPDRLLGLLIELVFVLLGGLVIWLGLTRHFYRDVRGTSWIILSVGLLIWGLRGLYSPGQWWRRWQNWTRGLSLALLGVLMLAMTRAPFAWVPPMLAACGGLLVLRGAMASFLILRPR